MYKALFDRISDKKSDTDERSLYQPTKTTTDEDDLNTIENQILTNRQRASHLAPAAHHNS